jgi:hypothetical protein
MTTLSIELGVEKVKGSVIETKGDGKWVGDKLVYNQDVDFSQLTAEDVKALMVANWKINFNAKIKPLGEKAVRKFFAGLTDPINAAEYLPGSGGNAGAGMFKECFGAVKALRLAKFSEEKICETLSTEYGTDKVKEVMVGRNPWKSVSKTGTTEPKASAVLMLDENQKTEVLRTAKQVQSEMAALEVADRLDEVIRLCGFSEKLSGIVKTYASQIIK